MESLYPNKDFKGMGKRFFGGRINNGLQTIASLRKGADVTAQRYFTQLSAAGGQHYTIPTVTIGASDDFEFEFTGTFSLNGFWLMADTVNSDDLNKGRMVLTSARLLVVNGRNYGDSITAGQFTSLTDGRIHRLRVTKASTSLTLHIDDALVMTRIYEVSSGANNYNAIARRWGGTSGVPDFNGYLSDVKITINGNLIRRYPLDDTGVTNVARELVSGADGTRVNLTQASTKLFTKDGNTWVSGSTVLEIAT
jgi:hypothetical protein